MKKKNGHGDSCFLYSFIREYAVPYRKHNKRPQQFSTLLSYHDTFINFQRLMHVHTSCVNSFTLEVIRITLV